MSTSVALTGTHGGGVTTFAGADPGNCAQLIVTDAYGNEGEI